jgi:hypothetical protein
MGETAETIIDSKARDERDRKTGRSQVGMMDSMQNTTAKQRYQLSTSQRYQINGANNQMVKEAAKVQRNLTKQASSTNTKASRADLYEKQAKQSCTKQAEKRYETG